MATQNIIPASLLSSFASAGTPNFLGGTKTIVAAAGIPSSFVSGIATLVGGAGGVRAYIGNVDVTKYLKPGGMRQPRYGASGGGGATGAATGGALTITQTAIGRATCSFDMFVGDNSGYVPRATQTVIISENGQKLFAGCIKACSSDLLQPQFTRSPISPIFHIDCNDKSSICDNRVVIKTYPVGTDVQSMILDIVANFLNGEGITTQGVNVQDTLTSAMVFNTVTVSAAFDQITALTGVEWWVDMNGVLYFTVIQTSPAAPFGITATSNNVRNFVSTETTQGYANKFYAVSNLVVLPNGASGQSAGGAVTVSLANSQGSGYHATDTFSLTGGDGNAVGVVNTVDGIGRVLTYTLTAPGTGYHVGLVATAAITGTGTGLNINITGVSTLQNGPTGVVRTEKYTFQLLSGASYQEAAWKAGLAPGYVLLNLPIKVLVSVTINGTPVNTYPLSGGFQPGNAYYWFDGDAQAAVIFPEGFVPSVGDVIVVGYVPVNQNATVQIGTPLTGTCGSGEVDGVIQVPNIDVQSQLDAIAAAYLARNGTIPFLVSYETDHLGLAVGQAQSINLPVVGLGTTTIYITSVTLSIESSNSAANPIYSGTAFRCVVEATTQQNIGNWITWFERFISRTNFPLPVSRYEVAHMVLAPGSQLNLGGGTVLTNSYIVQNAGLIFDVVAQAVAAPMGEDLLLDFTINGVSLLGTNPLVIPAGSTLLVSTLKFPPGSAVFKGDLIRCTGVYRTTTLSPTPAGSVSLDCYWSY